MPNDEPARIKPLLTIKEAAELLNVPAAPLRREAQRHGFLVMFGRAARLRRQDLDALLDCCRVRPPAP